MTYRIIGVRTLRLRKCLEPLHLVAHATVKLCNLCSRADAALDGGALEVAVAMLGNTVGKIIELPLRVLFLFLGLLASATLDPRDPVVSRPYVLARQGYGRHTLREALRF